MMVKHIYQLLIIILSFSNIFSQNTTLWDFGVIINKKSTTKESSIKPNAVKSNLESINIKIDAIIADPFIKPTKVMAGARFLATIQPNIVCIRVTRIFALAAAITIIVQYTYSYIPRLALD